ncbi:hypothetical protein CHUAL_003735 [Chamberlinius hualienensis]
MDNITDMYATDCVNSNYVKPLRLKYKQNGIEKDWDIITVHRSVAILIFNKSRNVLVFVRQFRPAVYFNSIPEEGRKGIVDTVKYPGKIGVTLEVCAGIVDKDLPLEDIARIEVLEECGYDVPSSNFYRISSHRSGVGVSGDIQTVFYVEVTDEMRVTAGGGNVSEGEMIDVVEMSIAELREYVKQDEVASPGGFLYLAYWFFANKASLYENVNKIG